MDWCSQYIALHPLIIIDLKKILTQTVDWGCVKDNEEFE
jgi:hypothetical protein